MSLQVLLVPHPEYPPHAVEGVEVTADIRRGPSVLAYRVRGRMPKLPAPALPERTDALWKHTCFELFVKPAGGEGYFEYNFAPSTQWAAYRFDGYREGMRDQPLAAPLIEPLEDGIRVQVDLGGLPEGVWHVAITAVTEEADGAKSYWSAAHAPGPPDFHAPGSFVIEVPAG
ncbi:DOMON-like domain-containing protein [Nostoc ellipsosporum NOK]|uniref:DOMON-like domain-containing protein n=1 Tax=Sphingomonas sp. IBVSS2 TaxID=1985172 RepID=UPI000A32056B|nr:DOMON-like domain-containing protein [Sphingomonas sp. IBVSS2]MDF2387506.1 DOMON-like domain-containing protein [Nostoc ellipsosporum NOK]